jgi:DNA-directed RNA polymerase specialized sigma24 family protein
VRDPSDGNKLEILYLRHGPEALKLAYVLTGDRELSEDLMQEAGWLAGWRAWQGSNLRPAA